jgi:hypothetical protein
MTPSDRPTLPERVTILETLMPVVHEKMAHFDKTLGDQGALLNTIHLQVSSVAQNLNTVNGERSRWKDPMLYVTAISVLVALFAVFHH